MAWADTTNESDNLYWEQQPDWGKPVTFLPKFITAIAVAHSGAEQRARRRNASRREFAFVLDGQDRSTFPARKARIIKELGLPIVIPLWNLPFAITSTGGAGPDRYTITPPAGVTSLDETDFRRNGIVYFTQTGKTPCFHRIINWKYLSDLTFQINTTPLYPAVSFQVFGTTATVYPCIRGVRLENKAELALHRFDETEEKFHLYEL